MTRKEKLDLVNEVYEVAERLWRADRVLALAAFELVVEHSGDDPHKLNCAMDRAWDNIETGIEEGHFDDD